MKTIFSQRLKEERTAKKITQQELADMINEEELTDTKVSRNSITRYENGTRTPDYDTLSAIAFSLNVDVDYLIGRSNKKHFRFANDKLTRFLDLITTTIDNDNERINDILWAILNDFSNIVKQGVKHDLLDSSANIIKDVSSTINLSINTNNKDLLNNLEKFALNNLRSYIQKDTKRIVNDYIPIMLKEVELNGISALSDNEIQMLKSFYYDHNIDDIPNIIKDIFVKEGE